ncbi:PAS domain S-box protein, partial [Candidatus Poribacteria bacterium]|nr:PAS domain S-box protein [Candidatus Poribacteria bacterium]
VTLEEVLGADSPVIRMVDELFRAGNPVHRKRLPVSVTNRKDRQPGYYDISYLPVKAADGTITAMAAFVVDVTEHVLAEKTLRENEERYQLLFESVTDVIYTIDREFRVTSITPSVETISGYKPEEIVGRRIDELELVPPEYIEQAFNRTTMSLAGQPTPPIEYQFIAKDGTRKFCEVNAASLVKDDKIIGSIDVVRDITDRKRMEEALRQSEERYGEIIANVNEVFFELDESGAFTYYSHQMFDSLGYSEGDLIGKQAIEYIHPDDVPQVVRAIEEAFSGKVVRGLEYRFRSKSGEYRWFLTSGRAGDSRNGKGRVVQGMSMDITGRKQAEQELLETKEHLQSLMDNANDIVYTQDLEGNLTFVNRRGLDILGYNVAEWIGVDPHVLMSQEEAEKGLQHRTLVHAGIPQSYETRLRHRDGSLRLFSVNEVPIWKAGKVSGAFGIARDITEKRKLREDLLETRNYLQGLLDNASDIIFTADLDDRITFINHKGIETASELGIDWRALDARSIVAPEDRVYEASRQERLREGIPQSGEIRVVTKKSGVRTYSVNSAPIIKDGNPVGVVGIARDVTEQKELERALEKSRTEAHLLSKRLIEVQEEERRRISRDLHDELGQFVTSVKMDVDSLLKFVNIKDCELDRIAHNVHRTLAATLATIRRISTALRPNILDDIGLVAAIEAYLEQFQATTRIKCEWKCRVEREGYGSTIDTCLYRILQEALNNVIRHARAAFVRVELFQKNGKLVMVIEDNGLGFDVSGTGANSSLGIIGMKERVGLIGGSVIIHSTPGTGTIVEIEAPVAEEER